VIICGDREAMAMTDELLAQGLFVQGIRPPTVPVGTARLRVGLSAGHLDAHVDWLATALTNATRQNYT
jgi:8-amino-7-oxononanoate synthase